jgi:TatD DNase family protein
MKLVDTHCHIDSDRYNEDRDRILKDIEENLEFAVNIGYDLESSKRSVELADKYDFMYAVVGVHPTDIKGYDDKLENSLEELAKNPKVVAIGEMGLDYHWMKDEKEEQKKIFRRQLELARRVGKPVVIHTREATADTIEILKEYSDIKGILHCYPGSYESALQLMDNYYFGIGGVVTFKNSKKTVEAVSKIPLERLVIETDAPYLTPTPFRGKRNHPIYVEYIAQKIAEIKGISYEEVVKVTTENAKKVYRV